MAETHKMELSYQERLDTSIKRFLSDLDRTLPNLFIAQQQCSLLDMPIEIGIMIALIEEVGDLRDRIANVSERIDVLLGEASAENSR